ncbi:MAG: hypothetical protein H7319_16695 [Spirosoma sp.]|nr:hypothetical protein [Spirosoma sp.]
MRTVISSLTLGGLLTWAILSGCHQEPALPTSIVPFGCRVSQVDYIDTTSRSTYRYQYDLKGNRTGSADGSTTRAYTLDTTSGYVTSQDVNGAKLAYQYDGTPKRISRIAGGAVSYAYTYEGEDLKTYVASENGRTITYVFTGGKLTAVTGVPGETITVASGKISQRTDAAGNAITYTYTGDKLTQTEFISSTGRQVIAYTYDTKSFYTNTGLFFLGFPRIPTAQPGAEIQPGPGLDNIGGPVNLSIPINSSRDRIGVDEIGGLVQINNYQTIGIKQYAKGATETLTPERILRYTHQYNADGYSLGYSRTDGARARFYYTNCN